MNQMNTLPPSIVDLINTIRNPVESVNTRDNIAARLETIAQACDDEVKKFRRERDRAVASAPRRRKKA